MRFVRVEALKKAVEAVREALTEEVQADGIKLMPSKFSYEQVEWAVVGAMCALEQGPVCPGDLQFIGVNDIQFPSPVSAERLARGKGAA